MTTPTFEMSALTIAALRKASTELSKKRLRSYREQAKAISDKGLSVTEDIVSRFAANQTTPNDLEKFLTGMWKMLETEFPETWDRIWNEAIAENLIQRDPVTNALHNMWRPGRSFDKSRLENLHGRYVAYIPYFNDPEQVQVMALNCGVPPVEFGHFSLTMDYPGAPNGGDSVDGVIIPYEENLMFVGCISGMVAPYIFALHNFPIRNNLIQSGQGALLAAARGTLPTASPMLIVRTETTPVPCIKSKDELLSTVDERDRLKQILARGHVDWR